MANKIDKINVGGTVYDINLPTTATPSIASLTISENLTLNGQEVDLTYSHINAGNATSEIWFNGKLYLNNKEMNAVSVIKNSDGTVTLSITNF